MNARDENGDAARQRRRSGGGLSAADLLRREGRL
jgi:RND superfamily putative drug exporter